MKKLILNRLKCKKCGDVIESKYTHDFIQCTCGAIFVDGGLSYARSGGNLEDIEDLRIYHDFEEEPITLNGWYPYLDGLVGVVENDPRGRPDGRAILTSPVTSHTRDQLVDSLEGTVVTTRSGTKYKLGKMYDF